MMRFRVMSIVLILFASRGLPAQRGWCQQPPAGITARTLFYRENADNDQLPPVSAAKPQASRKADESRRTAKVSVVTNPGPKVLEATHHQGKVPAQVESGVVEPVSHDASAIPVVQHLGLRYNLLLVDRRSNETIEAADPARTFHQGDCLALEFEPNRSGYLYVAEEGSSGIWKVLFPSPQLPDESNVVRAQTTVRVPEDACFGIHPPEGVERVFIVLTRNPARVRDLKELIRQGGEGKSPLLTANINQLRTQMVNRLASRDLEIETVADPQITGERSYSVYVANVSNATSDLISTEIQIRHK